MQTRILGLLLSLSLPPLQGCMLSHAGSCGDDDCDHHARDEDDVATRVPAALVGQWYAGAGGVTSPYDPATGAWGTPTGQGLLYALLHGGEPRPLADRAGTLHHATGARHLHVSRQLRAEPELGRAARRPERGDVRLGDRAERARPVATDAAAAPNRRR
jgi:hypothetical protein